MFGCRDGQLDWPARLSWMTTCTPRPHPGMNANFCTHSTFIQVYIDLPFQRMADVPLCESSPEIHCFHIENVDVSDLSASRLRIRSIFQ
jgi:hypothetical protein